jgi:hypothetical protein
MRMRILLRPLAVASLLTLATACLMQPFKPEHGYPAGWPAFRTLSKGCPELNGTYRSTGTARLAGKDDLVPFELAELIPRLTEAHHSKAVNGSQLPDGTVTLTMMPAKSSWSVPYTVASITAGGVTRSYEIESTCHPEGLLYLLDGYGGNFVVGFAGGQTRVFMTRGSDGSLIVMLHQESGGLVVVVPYYTSEYSWARFEPLRQ